ncbi:MAG: serine/threonine protein kinase [Pseudobdellovibrionaceae bacterium]|nr:serine/threonine protein kinase [Bdellovibrionales bacterium]USN47035.1 MAG: serine/threonine protein kinase [Pseudobdellovibrionaceae bacterium]
MFELAVKNPKKFYELDPNEVMQALDAAGFSPTGEYMQLNSFENRVFDLRLEPGTSSEELRDRVIAKFYRPGRWSKEAILEEHQFLLELKQAGLPTVAPLQQKNGSTLSEYHGMFVGLFPKFFGRMPEELFIEDYHAIGRSLAQLHNVGARQSAKHRPYLNTDTAGWPALDFLEDWVSPEVWQRYEEAATEIFEYLESAIDENEFIRIHGDCHRGNLLHSDAAGEKPVFFFVDFDDFCMGPPAQDFWMLFTGGEDSKVEQEEILSGYEELREFDFRQTRLFEPLRGLRIVRYAAWIASRWQDPTFPQLFPQFKDFNYWAEETEALEKIAWGL